MATNSQIRKKKLNDMRQGAVAVTAKPEAAPMLHAMQETMSPQTAKAMARYGLTPLEYLVRIYRDEDMPTDVRIDAAKAALPYVHRRMPMEVVTTNVTAHVKLVRVEGM